MSVATPEAPTSVYLYFDSTDVLIYVGITSRATRRQREHNTDKVWWQHVAKQEVRHFPSRADAEAEERRLIRAHTPPFNTVHNPDHARARAAYESLVQLRNIDSEPDDMKAIRKLGLSCDALTEPLAGHAATIVSRALDARALIGDLDTSEMTSVIVSTPQRHKSGRVADARYVGGLLMLGLSGRYIPDEITSARVKVKIIQNRKPVGFAITRVMLNERGAA